LCGYVKKKKNLFFYTLDVLELFEERSMEDYGS
jgi:hypothetical protein